MPRPFQAQWQRIYARYSLRRGGMALIYLAILMTLLTGLCSLAVDYGRLQLVKTELRNAADGIAIYAARGVSDGTYYTKAQSAAADNALESGTISLQASDVASGNWASGTFTSGGTPLNCVRVSLQCSSSRGTAVPLLFGRVLGCQTCDVTASSYALFNSSGPSYLIVGLNSAMLQNNTITTDSYDATAGAYSAAGAGSMGSVASNGGITLGGTVTVNQNLYMQTGQSLTTNGTVSYGSRKTLASALSYSQPSAGTISSTNNNAALGSYLSGGNFNMSSGSLNVPAGNYYMSGFSMNGGTLNINGAAVFYINGNFTIQGGAVNVLNNQPSNFAVNIVTSSGANFTNLSSLFINLYCPTSPINVNGCTNLYGRFIGSQLSVSGSCALHADTSLGGGGSSGSGTASLVK